MRPEVETRYGKVQGTTNDGVHVFRGVPYARPPVGAHRFRPPLRPEPWIGVLDATRPGPAPPQASLPVFGSLNAAGRPLDEDCLSLNVWSPGCDEARRPVLVWIHGGGFLIGSGATPLYDGHSLARRGEIVVITINYRLGALGFLHLNGIAGPGLADANNAGLRDQVAALEWVRDNVGAFGGDPDNVTVCGQSAGAMSVGALLGSPRARSLFQRAIFQSGATDHVIDQETANQVARVFLGELGGPPPTVEALSRVPVRELLAAQSRTVARLSDLERMMVFLPLVDGELIRSHPLDEVRRGEARDISLLTGVTLDEWRLFRMVDGGLRFTRPQLLERFRAALGSGGNGAPDPERALDEFSRALRDRGAPTGPFDVWSTFQSVRVFLEPAARLAEAQRCAGGSAHAYLFTWRSPSLRRALGACHALDVPFVFGRTQHPLARPLYGFNGSAARLSHKMQHAWIRFARDGEPGHERLPDWEPYDARRATMTLGRRCELTLAPLEAERHLVQKWSGVTPGTLAPTGAPSAVGSPH